MNHTISSLKCRVLKVFRTELEVFIFLSFSEKLIASFQLKLNSVPLIEYSAVIHVCDFSK